MVALAPFIQRNEVCSGCMRGKAGLWIGHRSLGLCLGPPLGGLKLLGSVKLNSPPRRRRQPSKSHIQTQHISPHSNQPDPRLSSSLAHPPVTPTPTAAVLPPRLAGAGTPLRFPANSRYVNTPLRLSSPTPATTGSRLFQGKKGTPSSLPPSPLTSTSTLPGRFVALDSSFSDINHYRHHGSKSK